uniref:DUF7507 domain-containing protein n=1 Tax=Algibacter pacificus TaxID=2599389 RepID=UPI00164F3CD0|nr:PKD-like domain-containing protein [Algibacter pacificus]
MDPLCEGDKIYTFTYTDCAGNSSVYTYTYTLDVTTLPVVPANGSSTVECLADATQPTAPEVKDVCGNPITPIITENTDPLCEGDKVYTFTYTDCAGNVSVYTYTYTLDVTTLPVVPANGSSTVECLADATQPTAPEVKDVCGNDITPVITENTDPVCEGDKIYTFTYTDCAGNVSVYTYTYKIDKTILPVVPADAGSTVMDIVDAIQPIAPEVKDSCGNNIVPVITESADVICDGEKMFTFTYTDCGGNSSVYIYTYTIDVTSTLDIANTNVMNCSDLPLDYDLTSLTTLSGVTFKWTITPNAEVSGASNGSGRQILDAITNRSGVVQEVLYTIIPFNSNGCEGTPFELVVSIQPEPFVSTLPKDITCSNKTLNHDLSADVDLAGTTFSWVASNNVDVNGETTTASTGSLITDTLINVSGLEQTVIYTITPTSVNGCVGDSYEYVVIVSPQAEMLVKKSTLPAIDGSYDTVGEVIQYEITIENINEVELSHVSIEDTNADSGSVLPTNVTTIPAMGLVTFTASHTITQADLDAGQVVNKAVASGVDPCGTLVLSDSDDPTTAEPNDDTITILSQNPSVSLEKTVVFNDENEDGIAQKNETLTYAFKVINTGNVTLSNISIADPLVAVKGGPINLLPTDFDDSTFYATYIITQENIDSGRVTNSATVSGNSPNGGIVSDTSDDPNNATDHDVDSDGEPDDITVFTFEENPQLKVSKTGVFIDSNGDGTAQVGETIAYTFDVLNTGNVTVFDISITDDLVTVSGEPITLAPREIDNTTFTANYVLTQKDIDEGSVTNIATVLGKTLRGVIVSDDSDDPTTTADNDATITSLLQNPQLSLLKTSQFNDENGNGYPEIGESITYIFDIRNTGNVTISDIEITDAKVTVSGGLITLKPNERDNSTFTANYVITLADINTGKVTNTAMASGKDPNGSVVSDTSDDPNNPMNVDLDGNGDPDDNTVTILSANPQISVTKTGVFKDENGDGIAQVGETIVYAFNITNTGNVTISNIEVTDALVMVSGGEISLNPTENDNTTYVAVYTITQLDVDAGYIANTAMVTGKDPNGLVVTDTSDDPNNPTNNDTNGDGEPDDVTITSLPFKGGISLTKSALPATDGNYDSVGEKITYQLIITNTGNTTLTDVRVTDVNADSGSITPSNIASIAPGTSVTVNAEHTITQEEINLGVVSNTASVEGLDPFGNSVTDDSDDPNNTTDNDTNGDGEPDDVTNTSIKQNSSIELEKTFVFKDNNGDGIPQKGEIIIYNFSVVNTGNVTLSNIIISDAKVTVKGGPISLMPSEENHSTFYAEYVITQADLDLGSISNTATVKATDTNGGAVTDTSDDPNDTTDNDINGDGEPDDTTITNLLKKPELKVSKTGTFIDANGDGLAQVGENIKYVFDVSNTGNVTMSNIVITDPLVTVSGNTITLIPGETNSNTFTALYELTQDDVNSGFVENTATVSGTDPSGNIITDDSDDPTTVNDNDATVTSLARDPELALYKTGIFNDENGDGIPQSGETISYVFDIRNTGNVTVFNIVITDPIVAVIGGPIDLNPGDLDSTTFTAEYTIQQSDIDSGNLTNTALAVGEDNDGGTVTDVSDYSDDPDNPINEDIDGDGDPDDPTVTELTGNPELSLIKTGIFNDINGNGLANVGETITYNFGVTNTGNVTATNVLVTDALVAVNGGPIDLIPGQTDTTTFSAVYTISQFDLDSGQITNTAIATAQDPNGNTILDYSDDPNNPRDVDDNNDGNPDDDTMTTLPTKGSISIIKEALAANDGAYDTVGEQIGYNITVTNTGTTTLTSIKVIDTNADRLLPSSITLLVPGESVSVLATHNLTQADIDTGNVSNSATVEATDPFGNLVEDTSDDPNNITNEDINGDGEPDDITNTTIKQAPSLSLTKSADLAPDGLWDTLGEVITYSLEVVNTGNVTLSNLVVTDNNADVGSIMPAQIIALAPGESVALSASHSITQNDLDTGFVTNTALVTAEDTNGGIVTDESDDPDNPTNNDANGDGEPDDATVTNTPQLAILDITKTVNMTTYSNIGNMLTYTINVTNTGNVTLINLALIDPNATIVSGATTSILAPGETFTATAEHVITTADIDEGVVENLAYVDGTIINSNIFIREDSDDPNNTTNVDIDNDGDPEDPTISVFNGSSDIGIDKEVDNINPIVNDQVVFTITLTNEGSVTATNIVVEETLPSGYEFVSYLATSGTYSEFDGAWTVPVINESDVELLEITVKVLGYGDYLNTATISSLNGGMDTNPTNDSASAFVDAGCSLVDKEFSPNGDGNNDTLIIDCIERYPNNNFEVYNRWGNIVYKKQGYVNANGWDGTSNGRATVNDSDKLPVGTYYYILDLGDGSKPKVGWLYINR